MPAGNARKPSAFEHAGGQGHSCIVCGANEARPFLKVCALDYQRCNCCQATFLDPAQRPTLDAERARYQQHRNDPSDIGYRRFLSKLTGPLLKRLATHRCGLDYGCGPGLALACMMREAGHETALYDPFFYPDITALQRTFDFITCAEVAEHFHRPAEEFARFDRMLRPGGWLAVMTCFQEDDDHFADWYYRRDLTHVVFYRESTLRHIARGFGWACEIPVKDVALMQKPMI